eukprot:gene1210-32552_t
MVRISVLGDALKTMYNAEKRGKRQVMIRPVSKVEGTAASATPTPTPDLTRTPIICISTGTSKHGYISEFELVDDQHPVKILKHGYIGEFELVDDHRSGKIVVELNGRLNKCGVISPRYDISSSKFGQIILTTSAGMMDHEEARRKRVGGKVLGFFY